MKIESCFSNKIFFLIVFCFLTHWVFPQNAQRPRIITDRPDFTESTDIVPKGKYQAEFGYTFNKVEKTESPSFGELLVRIPLHQKVEFRLGFNSFVLLNEQANNQSGIQDATLGLKVNIVEREKLNLAVIGATLIPSGSNEFGEKEVQPIIILAAAVPINEKFTLASNGSISSAYSEQDRFIQGAFSISSGFSLTPKMGIFFEYFGFFQDSKQGPNVNFINGGATYLINNDLQIDMRVGLGLNGINPEYFVGVGTGIRI